MIESSLCRRMPQYPRCGSGRARSHHRPCSIMPQGEHLRNTKAMRQNDDPDLPRMTLCRKNQAANIFVCKIWSFLFLALFQLHALRRIPENEPATRERSAAFSCANDSSFRTAFCSDILHSSVRYFLLILYHKTRKKQGKWPISLAFSSI